MLYYTIDYKIRYIYIYIFFVTIKILLDNIICYDFVYIYIYSLICCIIHKLSVPKSRMQLGFNLWLGQVHSLSTARRLERGPNPTHFVKILVPAGIFPQEKCGLQFAHPVCCN